MAALAGPGAAEEPANVLGSLPEDLQRSILSRVSEMSRGYSHALVCREWAALGPSAQLSCSFSSGEAGESGEEQGGCKDLSQVSQELSLFPCLTSLDITAKKLPASFLSSVPSSLQHLWVKGEVAYREDTDIQGLARLQSLYTLSILSYKIAEDEWPLATSLRHLDLGGAGKMEALRPGRAAGERECRGCSQLPEVFLQRISELRELRVFRANLTGDVSSLPESMSRLTNLEELNLWAVGLESLFSGIGECRKLRRVLVNTWGCLVLPPSVTRLGCLSFMYLSAEFGVRAPPGMEALTSLRTIEMNARWHTSVFEADPLFSVPSLQQLQTTGLRTDMSMLTSLQELILHWNPDGAYPESMWALGNLRILKLEELSLRVIPEAISGLSRLEELQIAGCSIQDLPDSLAELPHLKKVVLKENEELRSLPPSIGSWPSLQSLHLKDLPSLLVPKAVLQELSRLKDLQASGCPVMDDLFGINDFLSTDAL